MLHLKRGANLLTSFTFEGKLHRQPETKSIKINLLQPISQWMDRLCLRFYKKYKSLPRSLQKNPAYDRRHTFLQPF